MALQSGPGDAARAFQGVTHIFFDVDGTLLTSSPTPVEIFRKALSDRGHAIDRSALAKVLRSPDVIVALIRPLTSGLEREFYRSVNARLLEHLGLHEDDVDLDALEGAFEHDVLYRPYPETIPVLRDLRAAGLRTGVVSNFTHRLPRVLKDTGLAPHLDTVTYSFETGAEKPHPKIFRNALARAGTTPEKVVMVGDSYDADYLGARRAGLHAVLLCRGGAAPNPCPSIGSLEELPRLLRPPHPRG